MSSLRLRALVLAAGLGTRLRPLTFFLPKPLLPIAGEPVVGHTLRRLARAGCEAAALNLHHLAETIPRQLGTSYFGLPIVYSHEPEILGTLGALWPLRDFLRRADVILLANGDSLCRWPLRRLVRQHLQSGADATLLLHASADPAAFGGGVGIDADTRVVQLRDAQAVGRIAQRRVFTGVHALSPRLLDRIGPGVADSVGDLYLPLLAEGGKITSVSTRRPWLDLGTPARYLEAATGWRAAPPTLSPLAEIGAEARISHSLVEAGVDVGEGAMVESSVLLAGARVGPGTRLRRCILGPGVVLPGATSFAEQMITGTPESIVHTPL